MAERGEGNGMADDVVQVAEKTTGGDVTGSGTGDGTAGTKGISWGRFLRLRHVVPLIVLVIGTVWSVIAANDISARIDRMTSVAGGTIVEVETRVHKDDDGDEETTYRPIVEFEDSDHIGHKAKSLYASKSSGRYRVGKSVSILYDPMDADGRCILRGEEQLARDQSESRGPLGIILAITLAVVLFILLP